MARDIADGGFKIDRRKGDFAWNRNPDRLQPKHDKYDGASEAWKIEFPGVPELHYWGSSRETYRQLQAAGWKFSSRYGWRKNSAAGTAVAP